MIGSGRGLRDRAAGVAYMMRLGQRRIYFVYARRFISRELPPLPTTYQIGSHHLPVLDPPQGIGPVHDSAPGRADLGLGLCGTGLRT